MSKVNFKPIGLKALLLPCTGERKTQGGIIVPDAVQDGMNKGEVVAVGDGEYQNGVFVKSALKVGDIVIYGTPHKGRDITIGDTEYYLIREPEVYGVEIDLSE